MVKITSLESYRSHFSRQFNTDFLLIISLGKGIARDSLNEVLNVNGGCSISLNQKRYYFGIEFSIIFHSLKDDFLFFPFCSECPLFFLPFCIVSNFFHIFYNLLLCFKITIFIGVSCDSRWFCSFSCLFLKLRHLLLSNTCCHIYYQCDLYKLLNPFVLQFPHL